MTLLAIFKRTSSVPGLVSIGLGREGFALSHVTRPAGGLPRLEHCRFVAASAGDDGVVALAAEVKKAGLRGARCAFVLGPDQYALRVIDAPDVEPEELRSAARWSVQDLVDFDVSDAAIDVFEIPEQRNRPGARRLWATAARPEAVRRCIDVARRCDLEIGAIDIAELALRNVVALHPSEPDGIATLLLGAEVSLITVSRDGALYVARWVDASARALEDLAEKGDSAESQSPEAEEARESLEGLVLEIQRSLDYHEHELRQRPAPVLAVAPLKRDIPPLADHLAHNLNVRVESLDLHELLEVPDPLDRSTQFHCLAAIGGALRPEEAMA